MLPLHRLQITLYLRITTRQGIPLRTVLTRKRMQHLKTMKRMQHLKTMIRRQQQKTTIRMQHLKTMKRMRQETMTGTERPVSPVMNRIKLIREQTKPTNLPGKKSPTTPERISLTRLRNVMKELIPRQTSRIRLLKTKKIKTLTPKNLIPSPISRIKLPITLKKQKKMRLPRNQPGRPWKRNQ